MERIVIDARGPTKWCKEGNALRKRVLAWKRTLYDRRCDRRDDLDRYADALNIDRQDAETIVYRHRDALAGYVETVERRFTDATGPTNWEKDAASKRFRASILSAIERRMYCAGTKFPAHFIA